MIPIEKLMAISGRKEISIRARAKKLGIKTRYKKFTKKHIKVWYTNKEAKELMNSFKSFRIIDDYLSTIKEDRDKFNKVVKIY